MFKKRFKRTLDRLPYELAEGFTYTSDADPDIFYNYYDEENDLHYEISIDTDKRYIILSKWHPNIDSWEEIDIKHYHKIKDIEKIVDEMVKKYL